MAGPAQLWKTEDGGDPFRHHPELRGLIGDPRASFFRDFEPSAFDGEVAARGEGADWRYPDALRNAMFRKALQPLLGRDLWVFAYGSLIWDPGFLFDEIRRARVEGYQRRFILWDTRGRGSPEQPGVMAALDTGAGCDGLVFRIAAGRLERELGVVWKRERIGPAYSCRMVTARTGTRAVQALAFIADHDAGNIRPELGFDEQVEALAHARGRLGANLDYIVNLKQRFDVLGIAEPAIDRLCAAAQARAAHERT